MSKCLVCDGSGWVSYPHPDDEGGLNGVAVGPCPACVEDGLCAVCGESMVDAGAVQVCVRDGFTFDEAADERENTIREAHRDAK